MNKDQLERLPRSKRLASMGRQKISKVDHLQRTEVIKRELSLSKHVSTPSKTVPLETQTPPSKKTTPSAKQLNRKLVSAPSKTVP